MCDVLHGFRGVKAMMDMANPVFFISMASYALGFGTYSMFFWLLVVFVLGDGGRPGIWPEEKRCPKGSFAPQKVVHLILVQASTLFWFLIFAQCQHSM